MVCEAADSWGVCIQYCHVMDYPRHQEVSYPMAYGDYDPVHMILLFYLVSNFVPKSTVLYYHIYSYMWKAITDRNMMSTVPTER